MTQLLSKPAPNLAAFSHDREAREEGRLVCGAQHITQARYEAERPLNSQEVPGQPRRRTVRATPNEFNRYYADIFMNLREDDERRDGQKQQANELATLAKWWDAP